MRTREQKHWSPWTRFRHHPRGWWSFMALCFLLLVCAVAPLLSNTRPLVIYDRGSWLFPVACYYPETRFAGEFDVEESYQSPEFAAYVAQSGRYVVWPVRPYSPDTVVQGVSVPPAAPCAAAWLGTDDQGRDVVARVLYGLRTTLSFALFVSLCSACLGIAAGAVQGYFGGRIDLLFQRFMEIWAGLPLLFLIMIVSSLVTPSPWILLIIMTAFSWPKIVGVVRAEFLRTRNQTYVRAAYVLGVSDIRIMLRHILPNAMAAAFAVIPSLVTGAIATLAALDFLGFGLPIGTPSLGDLLSQAKNNIFAPWLGLTAFAITAIVLLLINFVGEGLRDAFDPKQRIHV